MSLNNKIDDVLEPSLLVKLSADSQDAMNFIQQKRYSTLQNIGYTDEMVDFFTGRKLVKTTWTPHLLKGHPMSGQVKLWTPIEWWIYNEFTNPKTGYGYVLSPNQAEFSKAWANLETLEILTSGGRDSGKSFLGALFSLWSMVFLPAIWPNYMISLFAGAKSQTATVYEEHLIPLLTKSKNINRLVSDYDPMWEIVAGRKRSTVKEIELKLLIGSRFIVNPASTKAARSKHPDMLWLDEVVEAEDVNRGSFISSAISSLTAPHHMRIYASSTVHKHPNGWFANKIRKASINPKPHIFYINLSKGGIGSKTWVTDEQHRRELALKKSQGTININAEFLGEIASGSGNVFYVDQIPKMINRSKPPVFDERMHHIMTHDPGFSVSDYGLTILQTDLYKVEVLYSEFWVKGRMSEILERVEELHDEYKVGLHAVDVYGTTTIQKLQDLGFDVRSYASNQRPKNFDQMRPDEQDRFNLPQNEIAISVINEWLDAGRLNIFPKAGCFKEHAVGADDEEKIWGNQLLIDQMLTYARDEITGKPIKGNDDMVDSLKFGALAVAFEDVMGGYAEFAGQIR